MQTIADVIKVHEDDYSKLEVVLEERLPKSGMVSFAESEIFEKKNSATKTEVFLLAVQRVTTNTVSQGRQQNISDVLH